MRLFKLPHLALFFFCFGLANHLVAHAQDRHSSTLIIRSISVVVNEIFPGENQSAFYRGVNQIKINTKEEVIRRELLFQEGDPFDQFVIDESIRNLRSIGIVSKVTIQHHIDGDQVDVEVTVQDTWTLTPLINYSSGSGTERRSAGIQESNILGTGKRAELLYDENDGRTQLQGVWDDKRVLGSRKRLLLAHFDRADGFRSIGNFGLPFRSLVDKNSWYFSGDGGNTVGRLFENGEERFIYGQDRVDLEAAYIWAVTNPDKTVNRFKFGVRFQDYDFAEATDDDFENADVDPHSVSRDPSLLAEDRRFSSPLFGFQRIEPDFISLDYIDRFERVQDFNLGNTFSVLAGPALDVFGSKGDALLFNINDSDGARLSPDSFVRAELGLGNRLESNGFRNTVARFEVKYFNNFGPQFIGDKFFGNHTIASSFSIDYSDRLDRDRELLLGADNGLRGYESKTFTGDKRYVLNLEDRFHIADNVFQLVSIGGAAFIDVGASSNNSIGNMLTDDTYSDIGVGLRFGFPRSSGGKVFRVDLAFPLRDGPDGSNRFEIRFLLKGGQIFGGDLRSDSVGAENATAEVGLDS